MTLVSKRWYAAFYSERSLWRLLRITEAPWDAPLPAGASLQPQLDLWWRNVRRLVQRVAPAVEALQFRACADDEPGQLLCHLRPSVLQSLALSWNRSYPPEPLPALPAPSRFTGLTCLVLDGTSSLPASYADAVAHMQQLRQLAARALWVPEQLLSAAALLTHLTALCLSVVRVPAGTAAALALRCISLLERLELSF